MVMTDFTDVPQQGHADFGHWHVFFKFRGRLAVRCRRKAEAVESLVPGWLAIGVPLVDQAAAACPDTAVQTIVASS